MLGDFTVGINANCEPFIVSLLYTSINTAL